MSRAALDVASPPLPPGCPRLADFQRVLFFTGAGLSAESGVPTYRGRGGIWAQYEPERYASQVAFDRDPQEVWRFHNLRRAAVAACAPHTGHAVIAEAAQARAQRPGQWARVVTQNIDGMHQLAGSADVVELHGSLWRLRCVCGARAHSREAPLRDLRCPQCRGWWRPDIIWFGDALVAEPFEAAAALMARCDLLVSVGTSAVVYPAAGLPELARDAVRIEINPEATPASALYHHHLRGPASLMLRALASPPKEPSHV